MSYRRSETGGQRRGESHRAQRIGDGDGGDRGVDGRIVLADGGTADVDDEPGGQQAGDAPESSDGAGSPADTDADGASNGTEAASDDGGAIPESTDDGAAPDLSCPDCGESIAAADNFCRSCGTDVGHVGPGGELTACPACETDVAGEDSFCRNCGEDLDAYRSGHGVGTTDAENEGAPDASGSTVDAVDASGDDGDDGPPLTLVVRNREIQVSDGETLGREIRSVVMDTAGDEDDAVRIHREHVRFEREDGQYHVVDLGRNPTVVDGESLEAGDRVPVSPGDRIELSNVAKIRVEGV